MKRPMFTLDTIAMSPNSNLRVLFFKFEDVAI